MGTQRKIKFSDLLLAAFIVAVGAMLLVPLPTRILDFLIVINLATSLLLLLAGLYLPHALALLSFPSLLLLTTLFRVGLNVASTRLILTQADAGQVIQAFGTFLVRGEVVVGLIIFFILTVVNFLVISKGAGRVSEVAARFTLDALPGRQLSIDSDLRSGLISAEEAQKQRENLSKESQLYGSMDGAMKFVQGDAVVGIIIIFVNILGGIYLGVRSGLGFSEAIETYTILTVGDGLVNQIPAILVAICAGLVVTRVAAREGVSLAEDVRMQVFAKPTALLFAAAILFVFGMLQGIPALPFMGVAVLLAAVAFFQSRSKSSSIELSVDPRLSSIDYLHNSASARVPMLPGSSKRTLEIALDTSKAFPLWRKEQEEFESWWSSCRAELSSSLGLPLPSISIKKSVHLRPGEYEILSNGFRLETGMIPQDAILVEVSPACCELFGLKFIRAQTHPLLFAEISWVAPNSVLQEALTRSGVRIWRPLQAVGLNIISFCQKHPEEFFSVSDVLSLESRLERSNPGLLSQTLPRQFFTTSRITEVAQQLMREGIPIPDLTTLVELLAQYSASVGTVLISEGDFDLGDIVSFVRMSRRRHTIANSFGSRGRLLIIQADSKTEEMLEQVSNSRLADYSRNRMCDGLLQLVNPAMSRGEGSVVLVIRSDLKPKTISLLQYNNIPLRVVASTEIEHGVSTEMAGVWRLNQ